MKNNKKVYLILDNIRSTYNVGSIFRTADCAGVSKIYLVGVTPDPIDRFGRVRKDIAKVALGAETTMPWEHVEDLSRLIKKIKKEGFKIVALEQDEKSVDYKKFKPACRQAGPKFHLALILGEEVSGIKQEILKLCDNIIEIPMAGEKESLNVSVAAGVTLFRLRT